MYSWISTALLGGNGALVPGTSPQGTRWFIWSITFYVGLKLHENCANQTSDIEKQCKKMPMKTIVGPAPKVPGTFGSTTP